MALPQKALPERERSQGIGRACPRYREEEGKNTTTVSKQRQWISYMKYLFSGLTSVPLAGMAELEFLGITGPDNPVRTEIYRKGKKKVP